MRAIHVLADNKATLRDVLLFKIQGNASVCVRLTNGLPSDHQWLRWKAVPSWLTTATVEVDGEQVPEYRVRPGWRLIGFRGDQNQLPISWFETDADGNITAEPAYAPGFFLTIAGPRDEFLLLKAFIESQDANVRTRTINGQTFRFRRLSRSGSHVSFLRRSDVANALDAWGVPGHTTNKGESYEDDV